jgi:hypothetical protein
LYGALAQAGEAAELNASRLSGFIDAHCKKCHGPDKQKGDLRLDQLDTRIKDHLGVTAWQDVLDVLNTGEMPPEDEKQPPKEALTKAVGSITGNLTAAKKKLAATGGVISMRHLTQREYLGSMRDLFDVDLPPGFLPDDAVDGFDTDGSEQFFSLKQYEGFYKAGKHVVTRSLQACTSPLPKPTTVRHDPEIAPAADAKAAYEMMIKTKELIEAGAPFSEISKVNPGVADAGQARLFIQRYPTRSKKPIAKYESTRGKKGVETGFSYTTAIRPQSMYKVTVTALDAVGGDVDLLVNGRKAGRVQFKPGATQTSSVMRFSTSIFEDHVTLRVDGRKGDVYDYLSLSGPYEDRLSTPGFFETVVKPVVQAKEPSEIEIARMLKQFADRTFRYQGVDNAYIIELIKTYRLERAAGQNVATSLIEPLTAILTAPAFLYIKEKNDGPRKVLSQPEYAIRLAYFLWGMPPDQELYDLAASNKLFDKGVLKTQVLRMLDAPQADVFMTDFINQWAEIARFDEIDLPVKLIKSGFQASARRELSEFFKVLVRENLPLDNLIDSDFVVVDAKLAQTYGMKASRSGGFRKVSLPASSPRGGMLTQAGFLIIGGSGPRTSPTIRGAMIRDKFLHDPAPEPPPNIPAIENPKGKKLSVRQLVDRHKNIAQCASCHDKIDPIGYGLENFDYLGNWRTIEVPEQDSAATRKKKKKNTGKKERKPPVEVAIDASGTLGSDTFQDLAGLQQALMKNKDRLALSVYESLLSYGIGREIEFIDAPEIQQKLTALKKRNYPLKELIFAVATSRTFATK